MFSDELNDNSKEDVWSIGCIIIEMMINTILFRPQNDDPSLQLLCIVQYVGGLTHSLLDRFPLHIKKFVSASRARILVITIAALIIMFSSRVLIIRIESSDSSNKYGIRCLPKLNWQIYIKVNTTITEFTIENQ